MSAVYRRRGGGAFGDGDLQERPVVGDQRCLWPKSVFCPLASLTCYACIYLPFRGLGRGPAGYLSNHNSLVTNLTINLILLYELDKTSYTPPPP